MKRTTIFIVILFLLSIGVSWAGKPSPANVYNTYLKAIQFENFDLMLSCMARSEKSRLESLNESERERKMMTLKDALPKTINITKEEIRGNRATLHIETANHDGYGNDIQKKSGRIDFIVEDGEWRISREYWTER